MSYVFLCYIVGIIPPLSYNAYLNQSKPGVFTCQLKNQSITRWIINGTVINSGITRSRGIFINRTEKRTISELIVPATSINSVGLDVQCKAISLEPYQSVTSKETAQFRVQGNRPSSVHACI